MTTKVLISIQTEGTLYISSRKTENPEYRPGDRYTSEYTWESIPYIGNENLGSILEPAGGRRVKITVETMEGDG